jgi:hypothetical protein
MQLGLVKWLILFSIFGSAGVLACDKHKNAATENPQAQTEKAPMPLASAQADKKSSIQVIEFVLANKMESREPVEIVEGFNQGNARGFAFARMSADAPADITFVWIREGHEVAHFTTHVHAAKQWRTFSSVKLRAGQWKVILKHGQEVLAERDFAVT